MGTREVYEEKLRTGNLHHDPTINPGLGSARCPRCLSLLNPNSERGEWTITPVLHDATAVAGSGIGGMLGFVHGFNTDPDQQSLPPHSPLAGNSSHRQQCPRPPHFPFCFNPNSKSYSQLKSSLCLMHAIHIK
ncbi:hypothetical protein HKD37_09G025132 [Glycine soja]|uniref:Uncharacterized protein n=1 Tax=Glycine soja TaxID=3848 RepID=A0A445IZG9_GLYSO|nr:uncharacterized protein LOC114368965 isoform X2 [Glycine soja]RZB91516.1 hypothetical protein D0Y65_023780 [Glycine soja]